MRREHDLTRGSVLRALVLFSLPMMAGNALQQVYNLVDTFVVGNFVGRGALAAVGSSYTLMSFLTSVMTGLCMGSGALFSIRFGAGDMPRLKKEIWMSFLFIAAVAVAVNAAVFSWCDRILVLLRVPSTVAPEMGAYVRVIFCGIFFVFLYNFFAYVLRSVGNSVIPLVFLGISSVLNIVLDLIFVLPLSMGVRGAALATVIAQAVSGLGIGAYCLVRLSWILPKMADLRPDYGLLWQIALNDIPTCLQQSVMNFGILMIQGLVNSFGEVIMAAFAAAVKIDNLAYLPAQEFANAYALFTGQNYGAQKPERIRSGTKIAISTVAAFCIASSALICLAAPMLMGLFVQAGETATIAAGVVYLRIEGACYLGIGVLFLLYGYYRAIKRPAMSLVLTVISLGTRVALAYALAGVVGVTAIWWAIPIGWALADVTGLALMKYFKT